MRHGGGGYFIWWIDCVIQNEIGVVFNGTLWDDGGSDRWKGVPGKYSTWRDFMTKCGRLPQPLFDELFAEAPEEFRI